MNPTGTWLVPEIVQTIQDFEVGFFTFPSIDGSGISPPAGLGSGLFVAKEASTLQGAIEFIDYLLQDSTARLAVEKLNVIPAQPVNPLGLEVPEPFKEVLEDLSASPEARSFGYNIDVLAPQNFNQVMFTGFQEVLEGTRSPAALQDAWATAKKQGKIATQDLAEHEARAIPRRHEKFSGQIIAARYTFPANRHFFARSIFPAVQDIYSGCGTAAARRPPA